MKNATKLSLLTLAAAAAALTAACSSDSTTDNRDADVTAACTQSLNERQQNVGLEASKPLEGTTKIVTVDGGWEMTGEVYALKDTSGDPGTASQMTFKCTAKDVDGKIEASAFLSILK